MRSGQRRPGIGYSRLALAEYETHREHDNGNGRFSSSSGVINFVGSLCVLVESWYLDSCRYVTHLDRIGYNIFATLGGVEKILNWILDLPASLTPIIVGLLMRVIR